jgi:pimeloyl-ACP methyl ester carboxylesterase
METLDYEFNEKTRKIQITDGDETKPVVVLIHGTGGNIDDMTDPASHPDNNYDFTRPLPPDVTIGRRNYPGVGVWSCCDLDPKKDVRSWRDVLTDYNFRTAAYAQVEPNGFLAEPVREFGVVWSTLKEHYPNDQFVLLAQSRGGLLVRKFLKDDPKSTAPICKVITLHSPHTGSGLASIATFIRSTIETLEDAIGDLALTLLGWLLEMADSDAFQEMAIDSDFLTDLADGEQPLRWIEYYTFGGVSVRLSRIRSWVYTLGSAVPQWNWPPFLHVRTMIEVPLISPIADSLPNIIPELSEGQGDLLTADEHTRLPFAVHQTNPINHAETLWDPILQAQVLRILGEDVDIEVPPDDEPSFWD